MHNKFGAILAGFLLCLSISAAAADIPAACAQAVGTLCKGVRPGEGREFACLQSHLYRIEQKACVDALFVETTGPAIPAACAADSARICSTVKAGAGRRLTCLAHNEPKLTPACLSVLAADGILTQFFNQ